MEDIKVRYIDVKDYEDISNLNQRHGFPCNKEFIKNRINHIKRNTKDIIFVAEIDDRIVGYIHGSPYELIYEESLISIISTVIDKNYDISNISNKLYIEMENWAKENGFSGVRN